jgi:hypothetical protein
MVHFGASWMHGEFGEMGFIQDLLLEILFLGTTNLLSNHNIPFPSRWKHLYFSDGGSL